MKNKKIQYEKHLAKWNKSRKLLSSYNSRLIRQWESIPWYRFWEIPSFEKRRQIILDNWAEFNKLPTPKLADYFPLSFNSSNIEDKEE